MSLADVLLAIGVFLGGAAPWLEAVVVVPAGIVAGLNPAVAVAAGTTGNLITVAIAAWFGERIRMWWLARRRQARAHRGNASGQPGQGGNARAQRIVQRWGIPVLALLGPLGLGTQVSAIVAAGIGVTSRAAFAWVGAGTVLWSLVAAILAVTGMTFLGIG